MAYCTVDELRFALNKTKPFTADETAAGQKCIDAAADEMDHYVDRLASDPIPAESALANRVNVLRAVEWWKANDAAFGVIGNAETGALQAPRDSFARHGRELVPLKQQWGVA